MGFHIRSLPRKKTNPQWKVQYVSHKKGHAKNLGVKHPRRTWDIQKERWSGLGFRTSMTLVEAKARQRQLNAQLEIRRQEEQRKRAEIQLKFFETKMKGFLPEIYKEEFELRYFCGPSLQRSLRNKSFSHWRAAQKIILEIQLEPSDWFDAQQQVYDYLCRKQWSLSYSRQILRVLNLWGFFISRKLGRPFFSIPLPRGYERSRILDAYFQKSGHGKQSEPITPDQLMRNRDKLNKENYNWLYLSIWLGLRPQEVDQLKEKNYFRFLKTEDGLTVLWVFQTKLISVPPRYRWKLIPLPFREQAKIPRLIKSGCFRRPLVKTVKRLFGSEVRLYGGRKGFTDLMLSRNQNIVDISQWMGHSTIDRTWRSYKNMQVVHYTPAA